MQVHGDVDTAIAPVDGHQLTGRLKPVDGAYEREDRGEHRRCGENEFMLGQRVPEQLQPSPGGLILTIDQGTTNSKTALVSAEGRVLNVGTAAVGVTSPQPGWVEQDALRIWSSVLEAVGSCLRSVDPRHVVGITLSTQRESVVGWRASTGEPLGPVIGWQDRRTAAWCAEVGFKAADALMHGCRVLPLKEACRIADVVLTVTGVRHTLRAEHFAELKSNVVLANAGHFWEEIDVAALAAAAVERAPLRTNVEGFRMPDGRWLNLLGGGNIVNISCADGHPAEIMDMSFALQALAARHVVEQAGSLPPGCYPVPAAIDEQVARLKLAAAGIAIDTLTADQQDYLAHWQA